MALALLGVVSLAAGASAQLNVDQATGLDTAKTPGTNETLAWLRIGGAEFGTDRLPAGSPTPLEAEFYSVAFGNDTHGFAAGSECKAPAGDRVGDELTDYLKACPRTPVIYEYTKDETGESWHSVLPPDGDGFVGAIAFMPDGSALAVGGTGTYPKREEPGSDLAGAGRAWIYQDGFWFELDKSKMQDGMRGMTALDIAPRVGSCVDENSGADRESCGLAGAYRQLWLWKDGGFVKGWGTADPGEPAPEEVNDPAGFRFRVRSIDFVKEELSSAPGTQAIAVTSGCCDASAPVTSTPRALVFDGSDVFVKELRLTTGNLVSDEPVAETPPDAPASQGDALARRDIPDSIYNVVIGEDVASVVATPGGAPGVTGVEPASRVLNFQLPPADAEASSLRATEGGLAPEVSTVRLVAGDGETRGGMPHLTDWAVGSLTDTGQAVAYDSEATALVDVRTVTVLNCGEGAWGFFNEAGSPNNRPPDLQCRPYEPEGYTDQPASKHLFVLPTHPLNAFAFMDATESVGWAVGDRGALVRFGGIGTTSTAAAEEAAPKLGAASTARFAGSDVYDAFRPLPADGETAPIPSLASNGTEQASEPELVPGGAPNPTIPADVQHPAEDVTSVVMSRDGSEGWAVGAGSDDFTKLSSPAIAPDPTLYHYDGTRWSRCDIQGITGLVPPDPACASAMDLFDNGALNGGAPALLRHAVRVPLENDDDPSNDDEFEVFAIAEVPNYEPPGPVEKSVAVFRYSDGRWSIDETAVQAFSQTLGQLNLFDVDSVVFTSPNDGWIASDGGGSLVLAHWDGTKWWKCSADDAETRASKCGDSDLRLPLGPPQRAQFSAADERVYFATTRAGHPAILYKDPGGSWTSAYDPGCPPQDEPGCGPEEPGSTPQEGSITALAVGPDGNSGWAVGTFQSATQAVVEGSVPGGNDTLNQPAAGGATPEGTSDGPFYLLRMSGGEWTPYTEDDASRDYLPGGQSPTPVILDEERGTAAIHTVDINTGGPGVLVFDPHRRGTGRWRVLETPFHGRGGGDSHMGGFMRDFEPDGRGGAWLAARQRNSVGSGDRESVQFWHYTDRAAEAGLRRGPAPDPRGDHGRSGAVPTAASG